MADFGIAKDLGDPDLEDPTRSGAIIGSPAYASPEQIRAEPVKPQADIYGLGVLLYEMLKGEKPFQGPTPVDYIQQHLNQPLPPLQAHPSLDAVVRRATAKDPRERYPDVPGLLADFRQAVATSAVVVAVPAVPHGLDVLEKELENPYKGLRPFGEADAEDFFGRETLTQELLGAMAEADEEAAGPHRDLARFLAVVGPSGSGKSSVVQAGLIPALRRGGLPGSENWFIVDLQPGAHPLEELEAALLRVAVNPPENLLAQLQEGKRGLLRAVRRALPADPQVELVLVIDQFEEVFTQVQDEETRTHLLDTLVTAVLEPDSRLWVLLTLRADFVGRALEYVDFGELVRQRAVFVLPLTPEELEQAVVGPAGRVGVAVEPGLLATVVQDVGDQPGMLPLLQYALTELFERRAGARHAVPLLTLAAYRESGGVSGALARRAEELYGALGEGTQDAARQLFLRLIALGEGIEDTRRRVLRAELEALGDISAAPMDEVIALYGRYRLLTFDHDPLTRGPTVEVAHEALLREWSRLRGWLEVSRADLRLQRLLAASAGEWESSGREPSYLLRGARLAQFEGWAEGRTVALTQAEQAFLEASIAARERRHAEEEARRQRELETAQRLAEMLNRSEAQRLAAEANRLLLKGTNPETTALLALRSLHHEYTPQGDEALEGAARLVYPLRLFSGHGAQIWKVAFSPDGRYLLSSSSDGTARLWDPATGQVVQQFTGHTAAVYSLDISPDGRYLLTGSVDGTVRLWDVQTGEHLRTFSGHTGTVADVAFSPDGRTLLSGSLDRTARLWDVNTGQELRSFSGHTRAAIDVEFSADGRCLLTGSTDGTARLWDAQTGEHLQTFSGHTDMVLGAVFFPDGETILTWSQDKTARRWDVESGAEVQRFTHPNPIHWPTNLAISPDGQSILAAGYTIACLWDVTSGAELRRLNLATYIWGVAFSPDGRHIAMGASDSKVRLWETEPQSGLPLYSTQGVGIHGLGFSPDGRTVAVALQDGTARLWDAQSGTELRVFSGPTGNLVGVSFSPDGRYLLTSGMDATARLWDVQSGEELRILAGHVAALQLVTFSPDGQYALTGSWDNTARLWDVNSGGQLLVIEHESVPAYVAFSPDGTQLVTGELNGEVHLWDLATALALSEDRGPHAGAGVGEELRRFTLPESSGAVRGVAFSPDGRYLAAGDDTGIIWMWDISTLRQAQDGAALHTGAASGEEIRRFIGHADQVRYIVFSPDGRYILSGAADATARLWEVTTGQELRRFAGHADDVFGVAFAPDGRTVATASLDGTARLWYVDLNETIADLCGRIPRDLTEEEREQYNITGEGPTCPLTIER